MEFKDIASVAGKGGLFKIVKPTRTGVILETLDKEKKRIPASAAQRISVLSDISIYTTGAEESVPLEDIFRKIYDEFDDDPGVDSDSDGEVLKAFMRHVLPEFDEQRVYVSDIKKIVKWYLSLYEQAPDLLKPAKKEEKKKDDKKK